MPGRAPAGAAAGLAARARARASAARGLRRQAFNAMAFTAEKLHPEALEGLGPQAACLSELLGVQQGLLATISDKLRLAPKEEGEFGGSLQVCCAGCLHEQLGVQGSNSSCHRCSCRCRNRSSSSCNSGSKQQESSFPESISLGRPRQDQGLAGCTATRHPAGLLPRRQELHLRPDLYWGQGRPAHRRSAAAAAVGRASQPAQ